MEWDLFCEVVDNHGDLGVCWRLAVDLARRGERVRLFVDDASALAWMAPRGEPGVAVQPWATAEAARPAVDVVVETFGCDPPGPFLRRMRERAAPPLWIDLEYLSAEAYVERSHALPSPQSVGDAAGLTRWFYYPGFTPPTGGLLREPDLMQRRARFDAKAWLAARGLAPAPGERVASLFCYANPALPALLERLAGEPTLLLVTAGLATQQVDAALGDRSTLGRMRVHRLPWLTQVDYDHLLWACDLNLVRGEDSFVRAQWAGAPFVWQIYPQRDAAHAAKLEAFLARFLETAEPDLAQACAALWRQWNGGAPAPAWPDAGAWRAHCERWREGLLDQPDLATQLLGFVDERR